MKEIICTVCPKGCGLSVEPEKETVTGNACPRGKIYGLNEVVNPTRVLTTTVQIRGASHSRLPVKTSQPIPKGKMQEAMKVIEQMKVRAPVRLGDVILENILQTGADLVACKNMGSERTCAP